MLTSGADVRTGIGEEDIFAILAHAGAKHPVITGYSMSAKCVQWMCCMEAERVSGQILIAPAPAWRCR